LKNTALVALKSAPAKSQARTGMKAKLTKYTFVNGVGQRSLSASVVSQPNNHHKPPTIGGFLAIDIAKI
jgi:hypothetical protein